LKARGETEIMQKYIGKILDNRYEILEEIGVGGMAVVYKARCHRLNRFVAVKILKDEFARDKEFRDRFHAEGKAYALMSHINIVSVYDVSRSNSIEYIVMELIEGITLKQYMEKKGVLSWREALHFTIQTAKALEHAHGLGVIHRDIKPHNIMLLMDGTVKVADFGIARLMNSQHTIAGEAMGSVHYISPEQAKGSHIDGRTDIYSLGVMLYEMLTGRLPYEGDTPIAIAMQHINSIPLLPREINEKIPEALENIIMHAMSASLLNRYVSAAEMLSDLENFQKNPSIVIEYEKITDPDEDKKTKPVIDFGPGARPSGFTGKFPALAGIITAVIFIGGVIALITSLFGGGTGTDVQAPYLLGQDIEEILTDENFGFKVTENGEREFSAIYQSGEIMDQNPKSGNLMKSGGEILVIVSKGNRIVKMPDLSTMNERQARIELENNLGLKMNVTYEESSDVLKDYVISQDPQPDEELNVGDEVDVVISSGKIVKKVTVPNFIGMTEEEASREAERSGLILDTSEKVESEKDKGTVLGQDIEEDTEVDERSTVKLRISAGPKSDQPDNPAIPVTPPPDPTPAPTPNPNPTPTPTPNPTPTPTPTPNPTPQGKTKVIPIKLPSSPESFTLTVRQDGIVVYQKPHKASEGTVNVTLTGTGSVLISVYINDTLTNEMSFSFDS